MEKERPRSLNVAYNILNGYYISTAMWATGIPATGMIHPTYETFIWEWDYKNRERKNKIVKSYYHNDRDQAINFHFRFCRTMAWRQLRKKMETDYPYVEMNHN
jgi:hypothetical protein